MSVYDQATQMREAIFGTFVSEPAKTLPATGLASIFNVNNGPVLVTSLVGLVTVALGAVVTTITVGVTPTGGSSAPAAIATAGTVTSLPVGAYVAVGAGAVGALLVSPASGYLIGGSAAAAAGGVSLHSGGLAVVAAGVITITTSATDTGSMSWSISYVPLVVGANVTAV